MTGAEPAGRIMGLDLGSRRVGVALSDENARIAFPLTTLHVTTRKAILPLVMALVADHRPSRVVVGHPLSLDGSAGIEAVRAQRFAGELSAATGLPVSLYDERLTTAMVEKTLVGADVSRARRREVRDSMAAGLILQGYLDHSREAL
jgi:putative Holliday junction resolvase